MKNISKRIGIFFIVVMMIFTLLSNMARSITTAVVETRKAISGKITHEFQATGKVEADSEYVVQVPQNLKVEEILVKKGEQVEKGTALFRTEENAELERAREDLLAWERKDGVKLQELSDEYELAYDEWMRYLDKTEGWYWKAEDDLKEDDAELTSRIKEHNYLVSCKELFACYTKEEKIRMGMLDGNPEMAQAATEAARKACQGYQQEWIEAKEEYWEYKSNRERSYQFVRKEEEKKYREALEKAASEYQTAVGEYESNLYDKVRNVKDAYCDCMDDDGTVRATVSGIVKEICIKPGMDTTSSEAVILAVSSESKKVTIQLSADAEEYLKKGDECILKKYGSAEEVASQYITDIEYDVENPEIINVVIEINDETIEVNDMVSIEIQKQSEQYPYVIPASALRMSGGETFVLTVSETEGILGSSLKAKKVSVKILEQNGSYAAISSDEISDIEIITASDRVVEDGYSIRKSAI